MSVPPPLPSSLIQPISTRSLVPVWQLDTISLGGRERDRAKDDASLWFPGEEIEGLYRIERVIAKGGMGVIYQALELATNRKIIIKTLLGSLVQDESYKRRFVFEAEQWVRLGVHPHIIRAHTVLTVQLQPIIVAEYAGGGTLDVALAKGALPLERALDIAIQLCWGMTYAHDNGVVHRDLKPGNILFMQDGTLKITDFGLAKRLEDRDPTAKAHLEGGVAVTVGVVGTPEYIPPEQWNGRGGPASDIYSFGVLLYELVCGRKPFLFANLPMQERIQAYQEAHRKQVPPDPRALKPGMPDALASLMLSCLEKDYKRRPPHFRRIAETLAAISRESLGREPRPEPDPNELDREEKLDHAWGYLSLGADCRFRGDFEKAHELYTKAAHIFDALGCADGMGNYQRAMGLLHAAQGDYEIAMQAFEASKRIADTLQDKRMAGMSQADMGVIYVSRQEYERAMQACQAALAIAETNDNLAEMRRCYNLIGGIHQLLGEHDSAITMYQRSLVLAEALENRVIMSQCFNNIGYIFQLRGEFDRALDTLEKALALALEVGDRAGVARCYASLGSLHEAQRKYSRAAEMYEKSLDVCRELRDGEGEVRGLTALGSMLRQQEKFEEALEQFEAALRLAEERRFRQGVCEIYSHLGQLWIDRGNLAKAAELIKKSQDLLQAVQHPRVRALSHSLSQLQNELRAS